jgi:release factor glutamine methyltransferase
MSHPDEPWTIGRLLAWTIDYFTQRGVENPRLDAEILLASARGCQRIDLYAAYGDEATEKVRTTFRELVRRRAQGTPVAYLVGHREFYALDFEVTPDVLIPRPETEHLVVTLLDLAKRHCGDQEHVQIADVGTGSGVIAVCAAKHLPKAQVTAIDISAAALAVAEDNARRHDVRDRVTFVEGDLLEAENIPGDFDFIVSNPPYVGLDELDELAADVRDHEPHTALFAGERGTDVVERLVSQSLARLRPGGFFLIEIAPRLEVEVHGFVSQQVGFKLQPTVKDLAGLPRVVVARKSG